MKEERVYGGADFQRVYAEVDPDALDHNVDSIREKLTGASRMIAVVKADAYGHGATEVASHLEMNDAVYGFAVATAGEAFHLRDAGIKKPILLLALVLAACSPVAVPKMVDIPNASFRVSATEITNAQYEAFNPSHKAMRGHKGFSRRGVVDIISP